MASLSVRTVKVNDIPVEMADGTTFWIRRLFTLGKKNFKLAKSDKSGLGYMTIGLSLAPATTSGYQVCPKASAGCKAACIFTSGHAQIFKLINQSRVARTRAWFQNRKAFKAMLVRDIRRAKRKADKLGQKLAVRLNVFSDLPWEHLMPELFTMFPDVQFYDYTKIANRAMKHAAGWFPANYHLTFSRSETNDTQCQQVLAMGGNVTVVFDTKDIPATWNGHEVVNGDKTDLRFLDKQGVVVGLYAKGQGKKDTSGFVVATSRIPLTTI
jgi:hypothetical protein